VLTKASMAPQVQAKGLNLGCGKDIKEGFVNLDWAPTPGVDVVHDLDSYPWPFGDEAFETILAMDVYEHVDKPLEFMWECWRFLKVGGSLGLRTAAWDAKDSYRDPTHKRFLTENSFDYFCPGNWIFEKYGETYARGKTFEKKSVARVGDNYEFVLVKLGG
jgi:SAM-dependent methyltransferase